MVWLPRRLPVIFALLLSACGPVRCTPDPISKAESDALYQTPVVPPDAPLSFYFVGHSLVGRDMPAMLAQLA